MGIDRRDRAAGNVRRDRPGTQTDRDQNRDLGSRVVAVDVGGRIGLREAERLCFLQRLRERQSGAVHPRQDVVAGAVQDAGDAAAAGRPPALRAPRERLECRQRPTPRTAARASGARASASSSTPCVEMSCLLAVTTDLPASSDRRIRSPAGSSPPISSTTMSASDATTASKLSVHSTSAGTQSTFFRSMPRLQIVVSCSEG